MALFCIQDLWENSCNRKERVFIILFLHHHPLITLGLRAAANRRKDSQFLHEICLVLQPRLQPHQSASAVSMPTLSSSFRATHNCHNCASIAFQSTCNIKSHKTSSFDHNAHLRTTKTAPHTLHHRRCVTCVKLTAILIRVYQQK